MRSFASARRAPQHARVLRRPHTHTGHSHQSHTHHTGHSHQSHTGARNDRLSPWRPRDAPGPRAELQGRLREASTNQHSRQSRGREAAHRRIASTCTCCGWWSQYSYHCAESQQARRNPRKRPDVSLPVVPQFAPHYLRMRTGGQKRGPVSQERRLKDQSRKKKAASPAPCVGRDPAQRSEGAIRGSQGPLGPVWGGGGGLV